MKETNASYLSFGWFHEKMYAKKKHAHCYALQLCYSTFSSYYRFCVFSLPIVGIYPLSNLIFLDVYS